MIIHLRIEKNSCRTWLLHLIGQLKNNSNYDVRLDVVAPSVPLSKELQSLLSLEKMLVHRGIKNGADICTFEALSLQESTLEKPDIIIDLTNSQRIDTKARILKPRYNGIAGEEALVAFLLDSGPPEIIIEDVHAQRMVAKGTASLEAA